MESRDHFSKNTVLSREQLYTRKSPSYGNTLPLQRLSDEVQAVSRECKDNAFVFNHRSLFGLYQSWRAKDERRAGKLPNFAFRSPIGKVRRRGGNRGKGGYLWVTPSPTG